MEKDIKIIQHGVIEEDQIRQAPNLQLKRRININCREGLVKSVNLRCCVQPPYKLKWFQNAVELNSEILENTNCIKHDYQIQCHESGTEEAVLTCRVDKPQGYEDTTMLLTFRDEVICNDTEYGAGQPGDIASKSCDEGQEGTKTAKCLLETKQWKLVEDTCIVLIIKELLITSQELVPTHVPQFVMELKRAVKKEETKITNSSETISTIVRIISNIADISTNVNETVMQDVLNSVDAIIGDDSRDSWAFLNANKTRNASSELLGSLETLADVLDGTFEIQTQRIFLSRTTFNNSFTEILSSSTAIDIPETGLFNVFITTITFLTLHNVMPVRNTMSDFNLMNDPGNAAITDTAINAAVLLIRISATITNATLIYKTLNTSWSQTPQCVFWNFTAFDKLGAWDDEGCTFISNRDNTVTCSCNHLTSFSVLMATDIPQPLTVFLDIITYIGIGISLASLVICITIEGYAWKAITRNSTAFLRHISIINTALSLLIADICFIIGAAVAQNPLEDPRENDVQIEPCSTATFFMHLFYLAVFFWMLASGLLLFYRTVMVFSHMSNSAMMAIGFTLGYGCPTVIAVITVAVTAPHGYIRDDEACWLRWEETKVLLAFVIPALFIVCINIIIVIVVLFKMLRRSMGGSAHTEERHTLVLIIRCVAILTPLFGLTWSLGVGTMVSPQNKGIHIAFAFLNSLQGFSILVFGTLFDSKLLGE
ncbi:adhesion G-protein coupled receptor F1 [Pholidichthys leucotaenia]